MITTITRVTHGWGTFIYNPNYTRDLNISAPHPIADKDTIAETIGIFEQTRSRTFLMAGTHRDAHDEESDCLPGACEDRCMKPDATHNITHTFQAAVEALKEYYDGHCTAFYHLQFHGMERCCPTYTVYLSHGVSVTPTSGDKILELRQNLLAHHSGWLIGVPGDGKCDLDATQNVQGRLLNGVRSDRVCTTSASGYSGYFVHIEQCDGCRDADDWSAAISDTWPPRSETVLISNVTLSRVTSTTAVVSWQTAPVARTCLDLDSGIHPVFPSRKPISQAFQGVAYAPGEYNSSLAWWSERMTDTIARDVGAIAAAGFNAIVLYPAGPVDGAIHPWDQIVFATAAAHGLKIAFRLEWVPSPFDWRFEDADAVPSHYSAYLSYFEDHHDLLVYLLINMPLDDPSVPAATIGQQRAYVSYIYGKIKERLPGATVYANTYYGWRDELHQAPVSDLVDGISVVVYARHAHGTPFTCGVAPTATAPASALICKDQFDYYLDKAWNENNLAALGKPLVLDSTGFAPTASYASPDQGNGRVADSWAKVRAIATLQRYLEQDERLYGWSYLKLLHKDEAGWGLIDRRRLDDRPITTTHHLTLTDLFPATRYTFTLRAGDTASGPYTFTTALAPTPTNFSPLLTITKPPYGHELVPAGGQLTIRWTDDDPDDNATLRLYYDANDAGCDGTLIVGNLAEHGTTGAYTWTLPSTLPTGSYYIYGQINDGTNPVECDYGSGRFVPSTETLRVLPICGSITVDGVMDEPIWQHATPLTYAIHVSQTDRTTAIVRALWDRDYLYVGFEVQDFQVETADLDWDDDSVSAIFNNGEFRCRQDVGGTGEGECERALHLPPCTTLDQFGGNDCGYTVEMHIRWSQARITAHARDVVPADFLSVDHDNAPRAPYTTADFSKLSWDGDGNVDTTGRSLTLVSRCGQCGCAWLPIVLRVWR